MIYQLARDLDTFLSRREFPVNVLYGPERSERHSPDTVVILERDRDAGDKFAGPMGLNPNPKRPAIRWLGCVATILAQSNKLGARLNEHEQLADQIVDALQCGLVEWKTAARSAVEFSAGRYLRPNELPAQLEQWPGVVYVMRFHVARGVYDRKYDGSGRLTATLDGVTTTTQARYLNGDPEVVSGE